MPILERFRGVTATRIAPVIVLSLATPLAFAQTAKQRYSGAAAVSDVDGNGYDDYAVVKWHPTEKKNFVYITDGITGNYIDKYDFGAGRATAILSLDDANGNDQREVAVMRVNVKGKAFVRVRDGASGQSLSNAFVAGSIQQTRGFVALPDISGNDAQEYAVLTVSEQTAKSQVRIRDARSGRFVNTVDAYDGDVRAQALATVPSLDLNTNTELAVLGTNERNGQARVRLIDSLTGQGINDVIFLPGSSRKARGMTVVADTNGNEAAEIAVLYVKQDDGTVRVLTKDALTGQEISDKAYFNGEYTALGITTVVGAAGQDGDGIAVMARRKNGEVRVKIRNVASGEWISGSVYHGNRFRAEHMIQLDDLDDDGVGDLGVLHTRKSNLTARMRVRNPVTPKNIINTPVVGGDGNIPPIAMAGFDQAVTGGFAVTLDGRDSFDPDGNRLTYVWRQVSGPDVTDGQKKFDGSRILFAAPREVRSVVMKLIVTDEGGLTGSELVVVNALEDAERAYFVDGDNGSDSSGDGSRENPYATISNALNRITDRQDIYVMNRRSEAYTPSATLDVPNGTSLYGGYDKDWIRDRIKNRTRILSSNVLGVRFRDVEQDAWFEGFDLQGGSAPTASAGSGAWGLVVDDGGARLSILNNTIVGGDAGSSTANNGGTSYGVLARYIEDLRVANNTIRGGAGGRGADNAGLGGKADNGNRGSNGSGSSGGGGGSRGGGRGGNGGTGFADHGSSGSAGSSGNGGGGGSGGRNGDGVIFSGRTGGQGPGGTGGRGGDGGNGRGDITTTAQFIPQPGLRGATGSAGLGGGGGGGGAADDEGVNGGGGGGGGGGGAGGAGGLAGWGGGASIGLAVAYLGQAEIANNYIGGGPGGAGGRGGNGQNSGDGGTGGSGADGNDNIFGRGADGGNGGSGGKGGYGGQGGGGGGGPSIAIALGESANASLQNNDLEPGAGGLAGAGSVGGIGGSGRTGLTSSRRGPAGEPAENGASIPIMEYEP